LLAEVSGSLFCFRVFFSWACGRVVYGYLKRKRKKKKKKKEKKKREKIKNFFWWLVCFEMLIFSQKNFSDFRIVNAVNC
jgi:polyferredoxin